MAKQAQFRRRREIEAEKREAADRLWFRTASTIAVAIVAIYFMGLMWAINQMTGAM